MDLVEGDGKKFDAIELYSCFPCVPKMARRTLGLGPDVQPTVTGGLTFFGAPLNTYMTHAACAMVRKLRNGGKLGLLYGQGGFVTKHHAWCCRVRRRRKRWRKTPACRPKPTATSQGAGFRHRGQRQGQGRGLYGDLRGNGEIEHGVAMLRTEDDRRTLAASRLMTPGRWRIC